MKIWYLILKVNYSTSERSLSDFKTFGKVYLCKDICRANNCARVGTHAWEHSLPTSSSPNLQKAILMTSCFSNSFLVFYNIFLERKLALKELQLKMFLLTLVLKISPMRMPWWINFTWIRLHLRIVWKLWIRGTTGTTGTHLHC